MSNHALQFAKLHWESEKIMRVGGLCFQLSTTDFAQRTSGAEIVLLKSCSMLEDYKEIFSGRDVCNILEFGFWEGGSPIYFAAASNAKRIVGIDIRGPSEAIDVHAAQFKDKLRLFYNTSQDDRQSVNRIIDENFDGPIDLVIDDASHHYELTKRAFDIAFPRLKVGGTYVIEDWCWAHAEDPKYDELWKDQPALSNLAFELTMAIGSYTSIKSMQVRNWCLVIDKGAETPPDFSLDKSINLHEGRSFQKI